MPTANYLMLSFLITLHLYHSCNSHVRNQKYIEQLQIVETNEATGNLEVGCSDYEELYFDP